MKFPLYTTTTMVALALAIAAAGSISRAQDQPAPPAAGEAALPPDIDPNSPLAQVVKLAQSGVDVSVINNYIASSSVPFNLDADKILTLKDAGVPTEAVNAMLDRDKVLYAASAATPPPASAPAPAPTDTTDTTDTSAPTAPVTQDYFDNSLSPYGSWVVVEGYGRCWRPTTVIYDAGWRPYCDRGHWVYTDCGWYWDSDYAWGATFHYGRWFRHAQFGWCWYPDTQWSPSWVTWRSSTDYCGWAPLPPLAVYRPGAGFFYRGASVSVNFDFGLGADYFTFVSPDHFCEPHPRRYAVDSGRVGQVYGRTTVINNFNVHDRFVVNNGIDVARIRTRDNRPIQTVHVGSLPNATREGWRGPTDRSVQRGFGNNNSPNHTVNGGGNGQGNHSQPQNGSHQQGQGNPNGGNHNSNQGSHNGQHDQGMNGNPSSSTHASTATAPPGSLVLSGPGSGVTPSQNHNFTGVTAGSEGHAYTGVTAGSAGHPSTGVTAGSAGHPFTGVTAGSEGHPYTGVTAQPQAQGQQQQWTQPGPHPAIAHPAPMVHPIQTQTRQYTAPSQPAAVERSESHAEPAQHSAPVQHSAPAASAPAQGQQHESNRGSGNDNKH